MKNLIVFFLLLTLACAPVPYDGPIGGGEFQSDDPDVIIINHNGKPIRIVTQGIASFMADEIEGRQTASGEIFHMREMTAAHPSLPFNTIVRVTNLKNNRSVTVRINDRGPFVKRRIIDLSFESAKQLGFVRQGTTTVKLEIVKLPN